MRQRVQQFIEVALVNRAQHIPHPGFSSRAPTKRDGLVEDTQGVAQTALRCPCEQLQRYCIAAYLFLFKHMLEMRGNQRRWNLLQVELQATRQNRDRNSLRICSRKMNLTCSGGSSNVFNIALKAVWRACVLRR